MVWAWWMTHYGGSGAAARKLMVRGVGGEFERIAITGCMDSIFTFTALTLQMNMHSTRQWTFVTRLQNTLGSL
jgi:hypothetical protein